jgi:hypothetical protein
MPEAKIPEGYIRVIARSAKLAEVLKHPADGGFDENKEAVWREDQFTLRRLEDNDVKRVDESEGVRARSGADEGSVKIDKNVKMPAENDAPTPKGRIS